MIDVVGLIPARSGSKGIPHKNLTALGGKPLISWTIEAALGSKHLTRTIVSTDSDEIAEAARQAGAEVPFLRPAALAADETPMLDVIRHAVAALGGCDVLVLLQPTSPLRRSEHIDGALDLLYETDADCVVSVVPVPHQFLPDSLMELRAERLVAVTPGASLRRQDKALLYARNGPAVLVLRPDRLPLDGSLYEGDCVPYLMEHRDSIDVDSLFDLKLAELLLGTD